MIQCNIVDTTPQHHLSRERQQKLLRNIESLHVNSSFDTVIFFVCLMHPSFS